VAAAVGSKSPDAAKYPHLARWWRQIKSYNEKAQKSFAKAKKDDYVSGGAAAADDDDDEVDLVRYFAAWPILACFYKFDLWGNYIISDEDKKS